jgi:hypothetical protein
MPSSVKGERLLAGLGVQAALDRGEPLVLTGPTYELRKEPETHVRLAFLRDDEGRIAVGYARLEGVEWKLVEHEPFTMRALGYYERRLKRLGDRTDTKDRRADW